MVDKQQFIKPKLNMLHAKDMQHIKLSYITHFYFDQKTPDTLFELLRKYEDYSPEILDFIHFGNVH